MRRDAQGWTPHSNVTGFGWSWHRAGRGSSLRGTNRYGKTFNRGQVYSHVADALARMLRLIAAERIVAALAVPDDAFHRESIESMLAPMHRVGVGVLWVPLDGGAVKPDVPWQV